MALNNSFIVPIESTNHEGSKHLSMTTPHCKHCGSERTARTERKGFIQKVVMFKLGLFPWECNACWKVFMSSERGKRTRRSNPSRSASPLDATKA